MFINGRKGEKKKLEKVGTTKDKIVVGRMFRKTTIKRKKLEKGEKLAVDRWQSRKKENGYREMSGMQLVERRKKK